MDTLLLSRLQFTLTIMFHYLFPPLTIGLGVLLVIMEGAYLRTRNPQYEAAARFWTKIFALNFAMGVVTGIVMEFQFGTNWSVYSRFVGDVFGSALAAEGIFAFFLESGFLAVLVFGWDKVSPRMHFFSTLMVSLGSIFSSIWIVVANSWQQTPRGHHFVRYVVEGTDKLRAETVDFWQVVFNYSTVHRLLHVWIGAFLVGAFFVMSITAWYILKGKHLDFSRKSFTAALAFAAVSALAALFQGDLQAKNVYQHQPAKLAAFEGHYKSGPGDLHLFGIPDSQAKEVRYGVAIPGGLSFLLHYDFKTPVTGLDAFPTDEQPPVVIPFVSFHIMVGLGTFFIAITLLALFLLWRGTLFQKRWLMWVFVFAVVGPYIANELGWAAAEVGRQPWIVQKHTADVQQPDGTYTQQPIGLRTAEAFSPSVKAGEVLASIIMFGIIYLLLFAIWIYVLDGKIRHGPDLPAHPEGTTPEGFLDAAARLGDPAGESMTDARGHLARGEEQP